MKKDRLHQLFIDFFNLPPETPAEGLKQTSIPAWDSLAMVQMITEMQSAFGIQFDVEEIDNLVTYESCRRALLDKGVDLEKT